MQMWLCFGLLEDGGIDSKFAAAQDLEDFVAYGLWVVGGVKHLVEMHSAPAKVAP